MSYTVTPGDLEGSLPAPPSKSHTHRAYVLAAQSDRPCTVRAPLRAADPDATLGALHRLGSDVDIHDDAITFRPAQWVVPSAPLDLRNAGTGLRLMLAQCARLPAPVVLDGDESLRTRPNGPLLQALVQLGATVEAEDGHCPIRISGPIRAGDVAVDGGQSSQFTSALLLALPFLDGESRLRLEGRIASRPYIDLSLDVARAFGIRIDETDGGFAVPGGQVPSLAEHTIEGDWSSAAFMLAAGAVAGGPVTVKGLSRDSTQADRAITRILASFGADVSSGAGVTVQAGELRSPGTIDISQCPDLFPVLCAVAAHAKGTTTFTGGAALRHKETDRIHAMSAGLRQLGIRCEDLPDGLVVHGGDVQGGHVSSFDDHRIHMAFCIAGLAAAGPVTVDKRSCVAISYPAFHADLEALQ